MIDDPRLHPRDQKTGKYVHNILPDNRLDTIELEYEDERCPGVRLLITVQLSTMNRSLATEQSSVETRSWVSSARRCCAVVTKCG